MRVVFATFSERTHFYSMVPLAWAMRTAGHEVRIASQPELTPTVVQAGLTAVPVGTDHTLYDDMADFRDDVAAAEWFELDEDRPEKLTWEYLKWGYGTQLVPDWWRIINDTMTDDLTAFCREWGPDLVVWEPMTYAGAVAAEASGAVHARLLWGLDLFGRMRAHYLRVMAQQPPGQREDPLAQWLAEAGKPHGVGFTEAMASGHFTVHQHPASLALDVDLDYLPMRYVPYNGPARVPDWLREPPERPRVCVTLGTSATDRLGGYEVPVHEVVDALADVDAEIVVTLAADQQEGLARVPANTRIVEFVPLHALLPSCSAIVHHGGSGTHLTAALNGVPQLVLPWLLDAPAKGRRLAELGAGLCLEGEEITGSGIRAGVVRLLADPSFRDRSARLRREILAQPSPNDVVTQIERRVARLAAARA
ncbi:activator-dependent family glycosyltransferase [Nocardiopsis sediminis]|uniref:Activator-dependent family glycosyltransferase n=1 Tax=Nocardiopsis sediminis TaxID=1778267 RepID=A0ABV8FJF0_9ACTN